MRFRKVRVLHICLLDYYYYSSTGSSVFGLHDIDETAVFRSFNSTSPNIILSLRNPCVIFLQTSQRRAEYMI